MMNEWKTKRRVKYFWCLKYIFCVTIPKGEIKCGGSFTDAKLRNLSPAFIFFSRNKTENYAFLPPFFWDYTGRCRCRCGGRRPRPIRCSHRQGGGIATPLGGQSLILLQD